MCFVWSWLIDLELWKTICFFIISNLWNRRKVIFFLFEALIWSTESPGKKKKVVSFWLDVFRFKQLLCFYLNPKVPKSLDVLGKQRKVVHQPSVATGSLDTITWFLELICDLHMKFTYKVGLKESLSPHLHWHIPATVINEYLSASVFSGFHPNVLWMNAAPAAGEQLC